MPVSSMQKCQCRVPNRLDIFMELGLYLVFAEIIQQGRELNHFSFPILNGTTARCLEVEDKEVPEVVSHRLGWHCQS
jgi:hypothetical protein